MMSAEGVTVKSRTTESLLWAACEGVAILLLVIGLSQMFTFIGGPDMHEQTRRGQSLVLFGSILSLAAAVWVPISRRPLWVMICLITPVVVINALSTIDTGLLPQIGAVIAIPVAVVGLIAGLGRKR